MTLVKNWFVIQFAPASAHELIDRCRDLHVEIRTNSIARDLWLMSYAPGVFVATQDSKYCNAFRSVVFPNRAHSPARGGCGHVSSYCWSRSPRLLADCSADTATYRCRRTHALPLPVR